MSISSYPAGFRGGALIKDAALHDLIPGNIFYVDSGTGGAGNPGTLTRPLATVQQGVDACTANNGDVVFVFAGHAETLTAQIDFDTAGVRVVGLGNGNARPTLTGNGTIDVIDVSAANCSLENFIFETPSTDAQTADINVDAAGFSSIGNIHRGSETGNNKVSFITVTANGDDLLIKDMRGYNDVVDMVSGIELAAASRVEIADSVLMSKTIGYSTGVIDDTGVCTQLDIHDCILHNQKAATAVLTLASNSTGTVADTACFGRHTTIASNILTGTGADFFEVYVTEEAQKNGLLIPTVDA